jgi:uncharacterized membrane protein
MIPPPSGGWLPDRARWRLAVTTSAKSLSLLRLLRDERGIAAVTVAGTLPLLFVLGALAINSGLWLTIKRQNQSAADAAALSAAYEVMAQNSGSTITDAAFQAASLNGYSGGALTSTCVDPGSGSLVCYPYKDAYVSNGIAVTLRQDQSSLFAYAPLPTATIATRAVAIVKTLADTCILTPDWTAPSALSLSNNASLPNPNCAVAS